LKRSATGDIAADCLAGSSLTKTSLMPKKDKCGFDEASNSLVLFTENATHCNKSVICCEGESLAYEALRGYTRHAHANRLRNGAQFGQHLRVAILVDIVNRVAERAASVEDLALDVDSAVGENVVDRA
jgi:hypothetical protein